MAVQAEDLSGLLLFSEVAEAQLAHVVAAPGMHRCVCDRHHVLAARRDPRHRLKLQHQPRKPQLSRVTMSQLWQSLNAMP